MTGSAITLREPRRRTAAGRASGRSRLAEWPVARAYRDAGPDLRLQLRMALTLYWGSGSPFSWRVLLALEHKQLPYESQLLHFDKQEHQSPHMLKLNPRGRVPVLKDGDYVIFESVAILYYLDVKYPRLPIFGLTPEEAGVIMRVICEFQAYAEPAVAKIV